MAISVTETFGHLRQAQSRGQCCFEGMAAIEQFATVGTVQPAPQRVLGRRVVHAHAGQRRENPQAFDVAIERLDQGLAETDHSRLAVSQLQQLVERSRQISGGFEGEEHMAGVGWNRGGENARLVMTHMNSFG
jgi:hypothetical protein